ncbi:MAG: hypothetical protein HYR89_01660, partial [Actinobacteria bacterium]|nr:hypothetical protein [Actinomycetota bacterium]
MTSSGEGYVTLSVHHPWATEIMDLPLHPGNAIRDAIDLLEPPVAHYVAQREKFMVKDPDETDTVA